MTNLNRLLKKNKLIVCFTLFAFLNSIAFASFPGPRVQKESVNSAEPPHAATSTDQPQIQSEEIISKIEAVAKRIPLERYDIEALARRLGTGIDAAFAFVRDRVRYEAYPGILRGAEGAFVMRAGNALDRSLLLAKLLELKGVSTRFASGRLGRAEAERLYAHIFDLHPPAGSIPIPSTPMSPDSGKFWERVVTRANRDYEAIRSALGDWLPVSSIPSREEALAEIEQHVWVQAMVNGRWVDLDSSFKDAKPNHSYAPLQGTFDEMPAELHQAVTIRVTTETLSEGALSTETALEVTMPAEKLLDRRVFLLHVPNTTGGGLGLGIGGSGKTADTWTPQLWLEGELHSGNPISFNDVASSAVFDELAGGGSSTAFVAEWLEFDVKFPNGDHKVVKRALLDRAGLSWRKAKLLSADKLRPLRSNEIGPVGAQGVHNIWFTAGNHNIAAYAKSILQLAQDAKKEPPPAPLDDQNLLDLLQPLALQNFAFLIWSDHFAVAAADDSPSYRFYADSPRILIFTVGVDPDAGPVGISSQYDLRLDHLRGLAREAPAEKTVVQHKVWYGALEGALEHEVMVEESRAMGSDPSVIISTSSLLTAEGAIALRAADRARIGSLVTDVERAARIARALEDGSVVVIPRAGLRSPRGGWWEISSARADTEAVLDAGLNGVYRGWGMPGQTTPRAFEEAKRRLSQRAQKRGGGQEYATIVIHIPVELIGYVQLIGLILIPSALAAALLILTDVLIKAAIDSM
ncbi:MAG: hypothetical protein AB1715_07640 [Acidobacteriota bacterium]